MLLKIRNRMARASEIEAATNRGHLPCLAQDSGMKQEISGAW